MFLYLLSNLNMGASAVVIEDWVDLTPRTKTWINSKGIAKTWIALKATSKIWKGLT